ncbi:MAG: hypothetical protein A2293_09065 [Elusimicrobia bacterium RIFOXYB2_FULL_49_7]|nr:MAG: hypothetical protein A2293_09065 [Elusimicrobia bacterium RIFOXYB2_FULL_49_7]
MKNLLLLLLFFRVGETATVLDWDEVAFRKINGFRSPFLTAGAVVLSDAAYIPPVLYAYSFGYGLYHDEPKAADFGKIGFTTMAVVIAGNQIVKHFVKRDRPLFAVNGAQGDYQDGFFTRLFPSEKYSCPSQSASLAASEAMVLGYAFPHYDKYFYFLMVLNAWSRVYKGAHYPGDVLLGMSVGALLTYGTLLGLKKADADLDLTHCDAHIPLFRVSHGF